MRPLEILLTTTNFLALSVLIIPTLRRMRHGYYFVLPALAIAVIQVLKEGLRWQMIPAYILAFLLSAVASLKIFLLPEKKMSPNIIKSLVPGGAICIGILFFVVSLTLPSLLPVFHLTNPTGIYQIGTVTYHWTDSGRREIFSTNPEDRRELMVQVWYPVQGNQSTARAPYIDDAKAMSAGLTKALSAAGLVKLPGFLFDHFRYVRTHAIPLASIAGDEALFPVLIYASGLSGFRQANMFQVENLASHGYIVVGLDQPYTAAAVTFPDGRVIKSQSKPQLQPFVDQSVSPAADAPRLNGLPLPNGIIPYLAEDISFTLDQLARLNVADPKKIFNGRLDLKHVGIFGVSLGAMAVAEAGHADLRFIACLMMDAAMPADVVQEGLQQPGMWLTRSARDMRLERKRSGGWTEKDIEQTLSTMQAVYAKAKTGTSYYVSIPGMFHVNFTDAPYWSPLASQLGLTGPIDGQRGFNIVNAFSLAFFDYALKGGNPGSLAGLSKQFPEIIFSTH